jgi:hypothetical protein
MVRTDTGAYTHPFSPILLGRPRSLVVLRDPLPNSPGAGTASQSRLSWHHHRNSLPVSTSHFTSRTNLRNGLVLTTHALINTPYPQSYRRFQVNFASASDAAQFIEAIRPVCPCKENTGPPVPPIPTNGPPVPPPAPMQTLPTHSTLARYHTSAAQRPSMLPPSVDALKSEAQGNSQERVPRFPPLSSSDLSLAPSSDPALPAPSPAQPSSQPYPHPVSSLGYNRSSQLSSVLVPDVCSSQLTAQSGSGGAAPSLPALSQPTSTPATLASQPTPPTFAATQNDDESQKRAREAFLESLREVPELYSLTRRELENLVSVVVREPGFPKLVRSPSFFLVD